MPILLQVLPVAKLQRTFRQAIEVAVTLEIGYIWIDALCIQQDSNDDWLQESTTMTAVYQNSWVNIAATASRDCDGGLFFERDPLSVSPCLIKNRILTHFSRGNYICYSRNEWLDFVLKSPLCLRSWVLQERILALKTLHFSSDQVYWQSETFLASDTLTDGLIWYDDMRKMSVFNPRLGNGDWLRIWMLVLSYYSRASLTFLTDELVATSGLARRFQEVYSETLLPGTYFAGLWRTDIILQLLWKAGEKTSVASSYRAPSWSWAAVDGAINFESIDWHHETLSSVVDVGVSTLGDEYGSAQDGSISLSGPLLLAHHSKMPMPGTTMLLNGLTIEGPDDLNRYSKVYFDTASTACTSTEDSYELVLAPMRFRCNKVEDLALTKWRKDSCQAGFYTRLGIFDLNLGCEDVHIFRRNTYTLPTDYYYSYDGELKYSYTIK